MLIVKTPKTRKDLKMKKSRNKFLSTLTQGGGGKILAAFAL